MIRPTTVIAILILLSSVYGLFQVKYRVQDLNKDLAEINRQIEEEQEAMHVLKAEWAYLNQPKRLMALVGRHLQLGAINVSQLREPVEATTPPVMVAAAEERAKEVKSVKPQPKPQQVAKLDKPEPKTKHVAAKEKKATTLAHNIQPLYPNMAPLLTSLAVE